jgi:thymidylate kinase
MASGNGAAPAQPRFVELIGPAGAGKSTLALALCERDARFVSELTLWRRPRRDLVRGALALAPTVAASLLAGRPLGPRELGHMLRMEALRLAADRTAAAARHLHLIDEGPVFGLAWLEVFYGRHDTAFTQWRQAVLHQWSSRLLAVIRLDADDQVLAHRIRSRARWHPVKNDPFEVIADFTARYRRAFDRVLAELCAAGRVRVVDLRTDRAADRGAAERVHGSLEETVHAR